VPKKGHIPERTCVACRRKFPKSELIRFTKEENEVVIDHRGSAPGRGAYLCKDCFPQLEKPKVQAKLKRALRIP